MSNTLLSIFLDCVTVPLSLHKKTESVFRMSKMRFPGGDRPSASKFGYADMEVWPLRVQPTRSDVSDAEVVKDVKKNNVEYNIFIWFVKVCKMFIFMIYFFKIIFLRMIFVYLFTYGNGNQNVCRFEVRVFVKPSILPSDIQSDMSTLSEECVTMHHIIHTWVLNILAYWISSVDWSWIIGSGKSGPPNLEEWKLRWCWTDWIWRR